MFGSLLLLTFFSPARLLSPFARPLELRVPLHAQRPLKGRQLRGRSVGHALRSAASPLPSLLLFSSSPLGGETTEEKCFKADLSIEQRLLLFLLLLAQRVVATGASVRRRVSHDALVLNSAAR